MMVGRIISKVFFDNHTNYNDLNHYVGGFKKKIAVDKPPYAPSMACLGRNQFHSWWNNNVKRSWLYTFGSYQISSLKYIWWWKIYPYTQTFGSKCLAKNLKWQNYLVPYYNQTIQKTWKQVRGWTCSKCNYFSTNRSSSIKLWTHL